MSKTYPQDPNKTSISKKPPSTPVIKTFDEILEKRGIRLYSTIGNGSYAKVKEGEQFGKNGRRRRIAAKIIDKRKAPPDFVNKFLPRELDVYIQLDHPNIIKVYDIFEIQHRIYIFMELAEGGDLLDLIKKNGAIKTAYAKRIFLELAHAIKYCHSLHITHRDLKCENVLLDRNFHVKLADFGFSRSCSKKVDPETGKRILSRTYCGSAAYAAPEILQGIPYNPKLYDIWSMGCILFIMVCGAMPFDDSNVKQMIKFQNERRLRYPSRLDVSLKDLLDQMLEPDVTRRANINKVINHPWLNHA